MDFSPEKGGYLNKKGEEIDFSEKRLQYHLFGTGYSDEARGPRQLHWLLYPHFPIENNLSEEEIATITSDLLAATETRKPKILEYMQGLEGRLKERGEAQIL